MQFIQIIIILIQILSTNSNSHQLFKYVERDEIDLQEFKRVIEGIKVSYPSLLLCSRIVTTQYLALFCIAILLIAI